MGTVRGWTRDTVLVNQLLAVNPRANLKMYTYVYIFRNSLHQKH